MKAPKARKDRSDEKTIFLDFFMCSEFSYKLIPSYLALTYFILLYFFVAVTVQGFPPLFCYLGIRFFFDCLKRSPKLQFFLTHLSNLIFLPQWPQLE